MAVDYSFPEDKFILIGKVANVHGLKGEIKIFPYSKQPENLKDYSYLSLVSEQGKISSSLQVKKCRVQKNLAVILLESIQTREQSEQVVGMGVLLNKEHLPKVSSEEYYWKDFIKRDVFLETGEKIGVVQKLFSNGAQDVLVIDNAGIELLIPVTQEIVVKHDNEGIVINPPPGLLDINSEVDE